MERGLRFIRGSVWYWNDPDTRDKRERNNSIQAGRRPVIIFSSNKGNSTSSIVNIIPLSLQDKPNMPINVEVISDKGLTQVALCNQLRPVSKEDLDSYQYMVSDNVMMNIEKGVMIANQMDRYFKNFECQYSFEQLRNIIEGIVSKRIEEIHKNNETNKISTDDINNIINSLIKDENSNTSKILVEEKDNKENKSDKDSISKSNKQTSKKYKSKWTIEVCKEFIKDKDELPPYKVAEKYGLNGVKQVCQYYYYCKSKLNKAGIVL